MDVYYFFSIFFVFPTRILHSTQFSVYPTGRQEVYNSQNSVSRSSFPRWCPTHLLTLPPWIAATTWTNAVNRSLMIGSASFLGTRSTKVISMICSIHSSSKKKQKKPCHRDINPPDHVMLRCSNRRICLVINIK